MRRCGDEAAFHAFAAVAAALFARESPTPESAEKDGSEQLIATAREGDTVSVSAQDVMTYNLEYTMHGALNAQWGVDQRRTGNQVVGAFFGVQECKDGHVGIVATPKSAESFFRFIGHPELIERYPVVYQPDWIDKYLCCCLPIVPKIRSLLGLKAVMDVCCRLAFGEVYPTQTMEELLASAKTHKVALGPVITPGATLTRPGFEAFWRTVKHSALGVENMPALRGVSPSLTVMMTTPARRRTPFSGLAAEAGGGGCSPRLGQHTAEVLRTLEPEPTIGWMAQLPTPPASATGTARPPMGFAWSTSRGYGPGPTPRRTGAPGCVCNQGRGST